MKKILFITPYPKGKIASQRFRFEQYFDSLLKNGYSITQSSFYSETDLQILYANNLYFRKFIIILKGLVKRIGNIIKSHSYDFIFIHRESFPIGPPIFEFILGRILNKKIIYDFDDAIWLYDPKEKKNLLSRLKWKSKIKHIIKWSYTVSCGNSFLLEYAKKYNSKAFLNPTTIDTSYHTPSKTKNEKAPLTIGWTGTHTTAQYLHLISNLLRDRSEENGVEILIISNKKPESLPFEFNFKKWNKNTEIEDLNEIDIGIMPLSDDPWSRGKCGFKALQYLAIEVPCLASPVGVNEKIINESKGGFLCETEEEWIEKLNLLIQDRKLRNELGKKGRDYVKEHFSKESNAENFLSLFD